MEDPNYTSSSDEESEYDYDNKWNRNPEKEKKLWKEIILDKFIYAPKTCSVCHKENKKIYEKKTPEIINPFYAKCGNYLCKVKKNLKEYSFLKFNKTNHASVILDIFYDFIIVKYNAKQIEATLLKKYKYNLCYKTIISFLHNIRQVIATYMKHKYRTAKIRGDPDNNIIVCIDESLILHDNNNNQIWFV